jgi:hypothetical protein
MRRRGTWLGWGWPGIQRRLNASMSKPTAMPRPASPIAAVSRRQADGTVEMIGVGQQPPRLGDRHPVRALTLVPDRLVLHQPSPGSAL